MVGMAESLHICHRSVCNAFVIALVDLVSTLFDVLTLLAIPIAIHFQCL